MSAGINWANVEKHRRQTIRYAKTVKEKKKKKLKRVTEVNVGEYVMRGSFLVEDESAAESKGRSEPLHGITKQRDRDRQPKPSRSGQLRWWVQSLGAGGKLPRSLPRRVHVKLRRGEYERLRFGSWTG